VNNRLWVKAIVLLALAGCSSEKDEPILDAPQLSVGKSWSLLQNAGLYSVSASNLDQGRVVPLFWELVDPSKKWIKESDRSVFWRSPSAFIATAQGDRFIELDTIAKELPGPIDAARWHVYSSWINAVARSHDPLASFYSPNRQEDVDAMVKAAMEGPGLDLISSNGKLSIYAVDSRGPAATAGVKAGGELLAVSDGANWWETKGMTQQQVEEKLRGKADTIVKIKVSSGNGESVFSINRSHWILEEFRPTSMKMGQWNVISVPRFYQDKDPEGKWDEGTEKDLLSVLLTSSSKEQQWILDLRGNPGGVLEQALNVASSLGLQGHAWALKSRTTQIDVEIPPPRGPSILPRAVWVDKNTGSSAEALAGIMAARGVLLVGEPTFGKTTLQMLFPLDPRGYSKTKFSKTGFLLMSSANASWTNGPPGPLIPTCVYQNSSRIAHQVDRGYLLATEKCLEEVK
jgi:C-terminal peptidase prc